MFANLLSLHSQTSSHQQGAIRISCLFVLTETGMFLYAFIEECTVVLGSCYNISLVCLLFFVWVYKLFLFSDLETSLMHHCWSFFCCRMLAVIIWAYVWVTELPRAEQTHMGHCICANAFGFSVALMVWVTNIICTDGLKDSNCMKWQRRKGETWTGWGREDSFKMLPGEKLITRVIEFRCK